MSHQLIAEFPPNGGFGPVATLPEGRGFRTSIWRDLDPVARGHLLNEILLVNSDYRLNGSIDFESTREPLFTDAQGRFVSIAGEIITQPETSLVVDITRGTVVQTDNRLLLILAAVFGLAVLVIAN